MRACCPASVVCLAEVLGKVEAWLLPCGWLVLWLSFRQSGVALCRHRQAAGMGFGFGQVGPQNGKPFFYGWPLGFSGG